MVGRTEVKKEVGWGVGSVAASVEAMQVQSEVGSEAM